MRERNNRLYVLAQGAMIAAIYVVLTILFAPISFGRKPGNADRGSRFMVCEEAQMVCVRPAHPCQYRHHPMGAAVRVRF